RRVGRCVVGESALSCFLAYSNRIGFNVENVFPHCLKRFTTRARVHCRNGWICLACKEKVEQGARYQTFTKGKLVNKRQLIDALAARFEGNKKAAAHALESVLDTITREVAKGEKVAITGFGSFEKRVREARWV